MRRTKSQKLHLVTFFFQFVFSSQDSHPARSETQSTIGSLRLSSDSDSDEGDIEERQIVSIESSDDDIDEIVEVITMNDSEPEIQICHSEDDDDQFIPRNQKKSDTSERHIM